MLKTMKIAIFANTYRPFILTPLRTLIDFFTEKGVTLMLEQELYKFVVEHDDCCSDTIEIISNDDFSANIALSIGGDGTFLSTAAHIGAGHQYRTPGLSS
jgi:NAD+ kinase